MKIIKVFVTLAAAEIFCLFINLTLAGSASPLIRVICAVCTVGILCVLLVNTALSMAANDLKQERITGGKTRFAEVFLAGVVASAPAAVSWVALEMSVTGGKFDFYRWFKLINAPFHQVCNLINSDASSAALTQGQTLSMLPMAIVPAAVFLTAYFLTYKGVISPEK